MGSGLGNQPRDLGSATGHGILATATTNGVWATATGNGLWATATGNGNLEAALLKHEGRQREVTQLWEATSTATGNQDCLGSHVLKP